MENLNDSDVNLTNCTNINCDFQKGFTYMKNNNTFNYKDKIGRQLLYSFMFLVIIILVRLDSDTNQTFYNILITVSVLYILTNIIKNPLNVIYMSSYLITRITRTPAYLDMEALFPSHRLFEEKDTFKKIQLESLNILKQKHKLKLVKKTYDNKEIGGGDVQKNNEDGWRLFTVKLGTTYFAENTMPILTKILKTQPNVISCIVSILPAKKAIPIHIGYSKGVMRYQLGIKVPTDRENVFICVNGEKYNWTEGEGVLFDDTYPHKVYNNTLEDRVVLYMDVIRPIDNLFLNRLNHTIAFLAANSSIAKKEIAETEYQITL